MNTVSSSVKLSFLLLMVSLFSFMHNQAFAQVAPAEQQSAESQAEQNKTAPINSKPSDDALDGIGKQKALELQDLTIKQTQEITELKDKLAKQQSSFNYLNKQFVLTKESADLSLQKESKRLNVAYRENARILKELATKDQQIENFKKQLAAKQVELNKQIKATEKAETKAEAMAAQTPQVTQVKTTHVANNMQIQLYIAVAIAVLMSMLSLILWKKRKRTVKKPKLSAKAASDSLAENATSAKSDQLNNTKALSESKALLAIRESQLIRSENFSALGYIASDTTYAVGAALDEFHYQFELAVGRDNAKPLRPILSLLETFNQIAADQDETEVQSFDVIEYMKKVVSLYGLEFDQSNIEFTYSGETELTIDSVPSYVALVLIHLINNALKHGFDNHGNGKISIVIEKEAQGAKLTFNDNGIGMTKSVLAHTLEPFFTTRSDRGYSGAGLHTAHDLITNKLNGSMAIDSKEGEGTTVTITLNTESE